MRHTVPLPRGWTDAEISTLGEVVTGFTPSTTRSEFYGGSIPFVRPQELKGLPVAVTETTLTNLGAEATRVVPETSVLVGCIGTLGKTGITAAPAAFNQQINAIVPGIACIPKWLFYGTQSPPFQRQMAANASATTVAIINKGRFSLLRLPVAPLPEQHRIVEAIESYLTRLDNAVALLERVEQNLKRYRASVLTAAVEGRLVPTEAELARRDGRSYEPASELLKRVLVERKARLSKGAAGKARSRGASEEPAAPDTASLPVLPEGWCWATLDQVCWDALIGLVRSRDVQLQGASGYEYLKMDAIGMDGALELSGLVRVAASATEAERYSLQAGDVLFNTRNSVELVGKTAFVRAFRPGLLFNNNIMRLRFPSALRPAFLAWEMCSPAFRARLDRVKRATTSVAAVYAKDLFPLAVALPPAPEQERITAAIERACSAADNVSEQCRGAVERCRRLRQSILNSAFEGKLIEQDPNDEPASALLDRIRAERAAAGAPKARGRRKRSAE